MSLNGDTWWHLSWQGPVLQDLGEEEEEDEQWGIANGVSERRFWTRLWKTASWASSYGVDTSDIIRHIDTLKGRISFSQQTIHCRKAPRTVCSNAARRTCRGAAQLHSCAPTCRTWFTDCNNLQRGTGQHQESLWRVYGESISPISPTIAFSAWL